jgi:hypothetical protein
MPPDTRRGGNSYSAISRADDWTLIGSCHLVPPASNRATEISSILAKLGVKSRSAATDDALRHRLAEKTASALGPEPPTTTLVIGGSWAGRPRNMTFDRCEPDAPGP